MRCRNSLELCPLLQWAAQQPQESINNIDLLWANNKHAHTHTHTRKDTHPCTRIWRKERQTNGRRGGEGEREKRGSPLTPISLHSSVHWTSERPLTTFPSIPWTRASTDGTCPPSSQSYSNNASVTRRGFSRQSCGKAFFFFFFLQFSSHMTVRILGEKKSV